MRFLIFISLFCFFLLENVTACSGDCVACHPKLIKKDGKMDKKHEVLERCKTCHMDDSKIEIIDKNVSEINSSNIKIFKNEGNSTANTNHTECGSDCWQCHDIIKVSSINIAEHKVLKKCIECHITIDKNFLKKETPNLNNTLLNNILKEH